MISAERIGPAVCYSLADGRLIAALAAGRAGHAIAKQAALAATAEPSDT